MKAVALLATLVALLVPATVADASTFSTNWQTGCAIKTDATLTCWGDDSSGRYFLDSYDPSMMRVLGAQRRYWSKFGKFDLGLIQMPGVQPQ